jgi:hypothetical protein
VPANNLPRIFQLGIDFKLPAGSIQSYKNHPGILRYPRKFQEKYHPGIEKYRKTTSIIQV